MVEAIMELPQVCDLVTCGTVGVALNDDDGEMKISYLRRRSDDIGRSHGLTSLLVRTTYVWLRTCITITCYV